MKNSSRSYGQLILNGFAVVTIAKVSIKSMMKCLKPDYFTLFLISKNVRGESLLLQ